MPELDIDGRSQAAVSSGRRDATCPAAVALPGAEMPTLVAGPGPGHRARAPLTAVAPVTLVLEEYPETTHLRRNPAPAPTGWFS